MSKYRNIKTVVDGHVFDSKREAARWGDLKLLERAGQICNLKRQVPIVLAAPVKFEGEARTKPALRLIVDFAYDEITRTANGMSFSNRVLEDVKGIQTTAFKIKRHLLKALHGMDLRLTA